jgi:hypothetical protein
MIKDIIYRRITMKQQTVSASLITFENLMKIKQNRACFRFQPFDTNVYIIFNSNTDTACCTNKIFAGLRLGQLKYFTSRNLHIEERFCLALL